VCITVTVTVRVTFDLNKRRCAPGTLPARSHVHTALKRSSDPLGTSVVQRCRVFGPGWRRGGAKQTCALPAKGTVLHRALGIRYQPRRGPNYCRGQGPPIHSGSGKKSSGARARAAAEAGASTVAAAVGNQAASTGRTWSELGLSGELGLGSGTMRLHEVQAKGPKSGGPKPKY
jgi:hypothetical protein